jgi:hypothetical protein
MQHQYILRLLALASCQMIEILLHNDRFTTYDVCMLTTVTIQMAADTCWNLMLPLVDSTNYDSTLIIFRLFLKLSCN